MHLGIAPAKSDIGQLWYWHKDKEKRSIPYLEKMMHESDDPLLVKDAEETIKKIISQD